MLNYSCQVSRFACSYSPPILPGVKGTNSGPNTKGSSEKDQSLGPRRAGVVPPRQESLGREDTKDAHVSHQDNDANGEKHVAGDADRVELGSLNCHEDCTQDEPHEKGTLQSQRHGRGLDTAIKRPEEELLHRNSSDLVKDGGEGDERLTCRGRVVNKRSAELDDCPDCRGREEKGEGQPQLVSQERRSTRFDKEKKNGRGRGQNDETTGQLQILQVSTRRSHPDVSQIDIEVGYDEQDESRGQSRGAAGACHCSDTRW